MFELIEKKDDGTEVMLRVLPSDDKDVFMAAMTEIAWQRAPSWARKHADECAKCRERFNLAIGMMALTLCKTITSRKIEVQNG